MSPHFRSSLYRATFAAALSFPLIAGCQSAMSQTDGHHQKALNDFPLMFAKHAFGAYCYNVTECSVMYANNNHTRLRSGASSAPVSPDYKKEFRAGYIVIPENGKTFPTPVQVRWKSLDGAAHEATIDLDAIFKDRRVLHQVPEADYAERSFGGSVDIILEVNDRTVSIYQKAFIGTKTEQRPGNKHSNFRDDLIQVWSQAY